MPATSPWLAKLSEPTTVLAAVSGGADSVYLAVYLRRVLGPTAHRLVIGHVNHRTRGEENEEDEASVRALAGRLGVECRVRRADGPRHGASEAALREFRLGALREMAFETGARVIAFAHQRDDAAEGLLLAAMRGGGARALGGLVMWRPMGDGLVALRPLLHVSRALVRERLMLEGQSWREDESNLDQGHRRNAVRHRVMPMLEALAPGAGNALAMSAFAAARDAATLDALAGAMADGLTLAHAPGVAMLVRTSGLHSLGHEAAGAVLRHLVREFHREAGDLAPRTPTPDATHAAMIAVRPGHDPATIDFALPTRLWIDAHYGVLFRHPDPAWGMMAVRRGFPFVALAPGEDFAPGAMPTLEHGRFVADGIPVLQGIAAAFDSETLQGPLHFRRIAGGESLALTGGGSKLVEHALQEAGVPAPLRDAIGGFADEAGPVWLPGIRQSARTLVRRPGAGVMRIRFVPGGME